MQKSPKLVWYVNVNASVRVPSDDHVNAGGENPYTHV